MLHEAKLCKFLSGRSGHGILLSSKYATAAKRYMFSTFLVRQ